MKIALIIPAYAPAVDYGGPVTKIASLAPQLERLGAHVEVWTSDFGFGRSRVAAGQRDVDGISVRYLRRLFNYRWVPVVPSVIPLVRTADIDIAHIFAYRDGLTTPAAFLLRRRGIPYVAELMGMVVPRERNLALKAVFDKAIGQPHIDNAALVIANSEPEADDLRSYVSPDRLNIVHNPIDIAATRRRVGRVGSESRLRLAAIGRLAPIKNLELLVEAVAQLPDVLLDIIGPCDVPAVEANLRNLIGTLKLENRVRLRGPIFGADLDREFDKVDLVVMPSKSESFGNAAIEAAARGVPVVVTNRCGVAPLIEKAGAGLVINVNDKEALVDAIKRLSEDRSLLVKLADAAPSIARFVAPEEIARQHFLRYQRILDGLPPLPLGAPS